jgi:hypothetical protein
MVLVQIPESTLRAIANEGEGKKNYTAYVGHGWGKFKEAECEIVWLTRTAYFKDYNSGEGGDGEEKLHARNSRRDVGCLRGAGLPSRS